MIHVSGPGFSAGVGSPLSGRRWWFFSEVPALRRVQKVRFGSVAVGGAARITPALLDRSHDVIGRRVCLRGVVFTGAPVHHFNIGGAGSQDSQRPARVIVRRLLAVPPLFRPLRVAVPGEMMPDLMGEDSDAGPRRAVSLVKPHHEIRVVEHNSLCWHIDAAGHVLQTGGHDPRTRGFFFRVGVEADVKSADAQGIANQGVNPRRVSRGLLVVPNTLEDAQFFSYCPRPAEPGGRPKAGSALKSIDRLRDIE